MEVDVWMDDWQMECCGEPFQVGDRVTWTLAMGRYEVYPGLDADAYEDHHEVAATSEVTGTVRAIDAVHVRFAPEAPGGRTFVPVAGSATRTPIPKARRFESAPAARQDRFTGYLIRLTA
ncbi:hypothetical protein EDD29_4539 [Actinocorallia herbida]|uniref:Uncharacterized protein n=1 Tax=Actinocorallia herbida TaxID=58109 RepID=A0A3N1D0A2_9ACTN|nr:DUF6578 domain-containing protein [Actinocorallia herbida]ROO86953.1 hypothetical protein EDD29_4539 [Actinocorallia herbida]